MGGLVAGWQDDRGIKVSSGCGWSLGETNAGNASADT